MVRRRSPIEETPIEPALHCSVEDQRRLLGASPFFAGLTAEQVVDIQASFRQQHYEPGQRDPGGWRTSEPAFDRRGRHGEDGAPDR